MADFNRDGKLDVFAATRQLGNDVLYGPAPAERPR